ncbi:MAG: SDR family oxidoreductase [Chloroflexi bacterium]|nr:SDR family oxidoreductase [Chloroflexota bacterium]
MEKVVIVTGAAGVLGGAVARAFGKVGDKVLVADINPPPLQDLVALLNQGPGQAISCQVDIRDYDQVNGMVQQAIAKWKRLDVIACIAGQGLGRLSREKKEKLVIEHTDDDWDLVMETNLKGTFHCIKAVAEPFMAQRDGHIIIMGSGTGSRGRVRASSYATTKAGLYGLMKSAALELGEHNIKVNVVNPGRVMHAGDVLDQRIVQENTLKRISEPSEVGDFYVHLSRMKQVSGQIFNLDSRIIF